MDKAVLLVAFHFPPAAMSSGHLRTLGFARYLSELGWKPIVLSARSVAYPRTAPMDGDTIPSGCEVFRTLALDARRHFSIAGKYPGCIAQPDRWASWWPSAVAQGSRLIRRHHIRAVWSTYPIMTAHTIARTLSHVAKIPWIADFRDPVAGSVDRDNPFAVASQTRWEERVLRDATRVTFTTPSARRDYAARYPDASAAGRLSVIENGYDEAAFVGLPGPRPADGRPLRLIHSGLLYPDGRNPLPFFTALARLKNSGCLSASDVCVTLRASGSEAGYAGDIERLAIGDLVTLAPPISNRDALMEQAGADALLLFQGDRFNHQIPAKLYEYLRIGRPILALVGASGDTAATLRETGGAEILPMDDADAIVARLPYFIQALRTGNASTAHPGSIARYSRREGAVALAAMLDAITEQSCKSREA